MMSSRTCPVGHPCVIRAHGRVGRRFTLPLLLIALLCIFGATQAPARAEQVTVFAAASLKSALDDVSDSFTQETGHPVAISYAGSSVLARQISLGAPADIFISANTRWMDWLKDRHMLEPTPQPDLLGNQLVLIGHNAPDDTGDLTRESLLARLGTERVAMALVDAVPAGIYGKAALSHFDLWETVSPHLVQTDNVRSALALVAIGEVPFGIVYATDAQAEPRVGVLGVFPSASHPEIRYPVAIISGRASAGAEAFLTYLRSPPARTVFEQQGFTLLTAAP